MVVIQAEDPWFHYLTGICLFLTGSMKPAGDAARPRLHTRIRRPRVNTSLA